ncbi:MAG: MMPL family transporter [Proteobacteria bacterium]|nr:MMPL family transporter [Pseudomonadota bacterium]
MSRGERPHRWVLLVPHHPRLCALMLVGAIALALVGVLKLDVQFDLIKLYATTGGMDDDVPAAQVVVAVEAEPTVPKLQGLAKGLAKLDHVDEVFAPQIPEQLRKLPPERRKEIVRAVWGKRAQAGWSAIMVHLDPDASSREIVPQIEGMVEATLRGRWKTVVVGVPVMNVAHANAARAEQRRLLPIVFVVFAVLLALVFRRVWGVLLPLAAIGTSALLVVGLMGWWQIPMGGPTFLLLPLVLVLGLADSIHLLHRYAHECDKGLEARLALDNALLSVGKACFLTSLTTAMGFLALCLTRSPMLQTFGALAAAGMGIALIAGVGLPTIALALMPNVRIAPPKQRALFQRPLGFLASFSQHRPRWVFGAVILATLVTGLVGTGVRLDLRLGGELPDNHVAKLDHQLMDQKLGGIYPLQIIVDTHERNGASNPRAFDELLSVVRFLNQREEVGGVVSLVEVMSWLAQAIGRPVEEVLGRPGQPELLRTPKFHGFYGRAGKLAGEAVPVPLFDEDQSAYLVWVRLHDTGARSWSNLLEELERLDEHLRLDISVEGYVHVAARAFRQLAPDLVGVVGLASVVMLISLAVAYRSWRAAVLSVLPLSLTMTTALAVMAVANINLSYVNLFVLSASLGLGVDALIHLLERDRELRPEKGNVAFETLVSVGPAISWSYLLLLAGLLALLSSPMRTMREVAAVLLIALAVNIVTTLVTYGVSADWIWQEMSKRGER